MFSTRVKRHVPSSLLSCGPGGCGDVGDVREDVRGGLLAACPAWVQGWRSEARDHCCGCVF